MSCIIFERITRTFGFRLSKLIPRQCSISLNTGDMYHILSSVPRARGLRSEKINQNPLRL